MWKWVCISLVLWLYCAAGEVTVKNTFDNAQSVSVYKQNRVTGNAERISEVFDIQGGASASIPYSALSFFQKAVYNILLLYTFEPQELSKELSDKQVRA